MSDIEKENEILERNVAALLKEPPNPPRMDPSARARILSSLKEKAATPEPAVAAVDAREQAAPARRYSFWFPAVIGGLTVLILGGSGVGYYMYHQSKKQKAVTRVHATKEKQMKMELGKLKSDQDDLRRINAEKDALINRMRVASVEEKKNILAQVNKLKRKAQSLSDSIHKRRAKRRRKGRRAARAARANESDNALLGL